MFGNEEPMQMETRAIAAAIEALDISQLTVLCEESELNAATQDKPHPYATFHLISLLLQDDLSEARFLWRRLPVSCKEQPDTLRAWALAKALWQSDLSSFYAAAKDPSFGDADPLISALIDQTRRKGVKLIVRAYSCAKLERVSALLGLDHDGVMQLCNKEGWMVDSGYVVVNRQRGSAETAKVTGDSHELRMLTEQLVRLQTSG